MSRTLFISDLHLDESRPNVVHLFLAFLQQNAGKADALYILGDLFEAWIGDDAVPPTHPVLAAMKQFSAHTPLYFMHGNRDFLTGGQFEQATGCKIIDDEVVTDLYGTPTLLLHGDTLCTDDVEYMKVRAMVRNQAWIDDLLSKTIEERIAFAKMAREKSKSTMAGKDDYITDANESAIIEAFKKHAVKHMIHGHTHRPKVHQHDVDGASATRIVLGDWYEHGSFIEATPDGMQLKELPLAQ